MADLKGSEMADLKGSECLSVEECAAVFQYFGRWKRTLVGGYYDGWKRRLVGKAAMKESYIVEKIASVMDKHVPSSEKLWLTSKDQKN
jgi:hypothetical protein